MKFQRDLILVLAVDFFSYVPALRIVEKVNGNNVGENYHGHSADAREVEAWLCREFIEVYVPDKPDAGENLNIRVHCRKLPKSVLHYVDLGVANSTSKTEKFLFFLAATPCKIIEMLSLIGFGDGIPVGFVTLNTMCCHPCPEQIVMANTYIAEAM